MACVKKVIRKLVREGLPENVVKLRADPKAEEVRTRLLGAAIAHCEWQCGGCELTRSILPPT